MAEAVVTADLDRERVFRRAVGISAAAHAVLLLLAVVSPFPRSRPAALPGVVSVSLVAAAPAASAPAKAAPARPPPPKPKPPEARPTPPPEPSPPQVKADKKLLPKDPVQAPKPKPKPAVAPPRPAPPPKPMDYDDALDSLRQELGEEPPADAPDPDLVASVQPAAPTGGEGGDPLDALTAEWMRRVKMHVKRSWILEPAVKRLTIQAVVLVTLDATGTVLEVELRESSGNPSFDTSVVRAVEKASPLPPPPDSGGEWPLLFTPQDVL